MWPYDQLSIYLHEIRILVITPSKQPSDPLHCYFDYASLDENPKYVALSYCWESSYQRETIFINNYAFEVRANLYRALKDLRKRGITGVWADAICINQADLEERSHQVSQMDNIYHVADSVVAWLGGSASSSGSVSKQVAERVRNILHLLIQVQKDLAAKKRQPLEVWKAKFQSIPADDCASFKDLIENPYWKRVWIIQELAVAKRLTIVWNHLDFDEYTIRSAVKAFVALQKKIQAMRTSLNVSCAHIGQLWAFRDARRHQKPVPLLKALGMSVSAEATEERDKVFAIRGLAWDGKIILPVPSYILSTEQICHQATLRLIDAMTSLDCIFVRDRPPSTWVLEWFTGRSWSTRVVSYLLRDKSCQTKPKTIPHWNASKQRKPFKRVSGSSLVVKGHVISSIHGCTTAASSSQAATEEVVVKSLKDRGEEYRLQALFSCFGNRNMMAGQATKGTLSAYSRWHHKEQRFYKEFGRMLSHDNSKNQSSWGEDEKLFFNWLSSGNSRLRVSPSDTLQDIMSIRQPRPWNITSNSSGTGYWAKQASKQLRLGQKLCVLRSGHIGWVTPHARPEDQIAIIEGCTVPVVLRKKAGTPQFFIIGDAAIYGLMEGEGLTGKAEKIVLA